MSNGRTHAAGAPGRRHSQGGAFPAALLSIGASGALIFALFAHFEDWGPTLVVFGLLWVTLTALFHPKGS
jgi:hypothetical protein